MCVAVETVVHVVVLVAIQKLSFSPMTNKVEPKLTMMWCRKSLGLSNDADQSARRTRKILEKDRQTHDQCIAKKYIL